MFESWDFQNWPWKNLSISWDGQLKGKEKKPTVVLEEIADGLLWIWAANYGLPGSMNEINILDASGNVEKILNGTMLTDFE